MNVVLTLLSGWPIFLERSRKMLSIRYLNADGAGFAEKHDVEEGTTIGQFLDYQDVNPKENMILINRGPVEREYVLQEGDRISVTPLKIEGA